MTYQSQALATPGLIGFWPLNEAAGATTAVDLGPNNLPLTYSAGKVNGVENVAGSGPGMLSSATLRASRPVAAGSALAPTAGSSLGAWITPNSFLTGGGSIIAGRTNHYRSVFNANGGFGSVGVTASGSTDTRTFAGWASIGTAYLFFVTYDGTKYRVFVNGELLQEVLASSAALALQSVADAFFVGYISTPFDGTISNAGAYDRALDSGQIWQLWDAGRKTATAPYGLTVDNLYDAGSAVVAAAAQDALCPVCHGKRRINEESVIKNGTAFHSACYAVKGSGKAMNVITATTPWAAYEGAIQRIMHLNLHSLSARVTGYTRPVYFDGTRIQPIDTPLTSNYDTYLPWAFTVALLLRHGQAPKNHWGVPFVASQMERLWSIQQTTGNLTPDIAATAGGIDFIVCQTGEALLCMKPYVDAATWARWKTNYLAMCDSIFTYPANAPESAYYVNGNREAYELAGHWMAWMVSGDTKWKDRFEAQYTFLTAYATKNAGADSAGNKTYGWVTYVTDTSAEQDGRAGKGYLIERSGSHIGGILDGNGQVIDGWDPNYTLFCSTALMRLWLYSRDPRILKMINMQYNMLLGWANVTGATVGDVPPMFVDGRNGSRQNNLQSFGHPIFTVLANVSGQPRISPALVAASFNEVLRVYQGDTLNLVGGGLTREISTNLGLWLQSLPTWPGFPDPNGASGTGTGGTGTSSDTIAPTVPTGLAASAVTDTTFTLTWAPSTDAVGVTGYKVLLNGATYTTVTGTSAAITGLTAGQAYAMRVQAYDAAKNYSAGSATLTVTTTASSTPASTTYPTASNTGVPAGTTLTAYTGSSQINTAGTVISGKTINFGLVIGANNVTIQNCKIDVGQGYYWAILNDGGYTGLQILDCTLIGGTDSVVSGNFTIKRCNISGGIDGMKAANADIQDCYIHDLNYVPASTPGGDDSHNDGIQCLGTTSLLIRHNTIINGVGPTSCVLLSTGSASDMRNVTIDNNLFAGGGYCVYGGYSAGTDVLSRVSNIAVTNNKISTQTWPNGGRYGALTSVDSPVVVSGNVWYDGSKAGQPVS